MLAFLHAVAWFAATPKAIEIGTLIQLLATGILASEDLEAFSGILMAKISGTTCPFKWLAFAVKDWSAIPYADVPVHLIWKAVKKADE